MSQEDQKLMTNDDRCYVETIYEYCLPLFAVHFHVCTDEVLVDVKYVLKCAKKTLDRIMVLIPHNIGIIELKKKLKMDYLFEIPEIKAYAPSNYYYYWTRIIVKLTQAFCF